MTVKKVLALNTSGNLTWCSSPEEKRGRGRCNHIAHQNAISGETPQQFLERIDSQKNYLMSQLEESEEFIDQKGTEVETSQLKLTDLDKAKLKEVRSAADLEANIDGGYIHLETPLWNDMDKNSFAKKYGIMSVKNINSVLHGEAYVLYESNHPRFKKGMIFEDEKEFEEFKAQRKVDDSFDLKIGTGPEAMNTLGESLGFEATKDVYVLPYYMRQGTEMSDHDLTIAYKYMLRRRSNATNMQLAYDALLDNSSLNKDNARYDGKWRRKSIADEFVGKSGVFRGYLSGSTIPYTARTVITPGTQKETPFGYMSVPPSALVDMFKPTLIEQLSREGKSNEEIEDYFSRFRATKVEKDVDFALTQRTTDGLRSAYTYDDMKDLERRLTNQRVIFNRQPSLHTASLQSARILVSDGPTTKINPMYCEALGADFDGDTVSLIGINNTEIAKIADRQLDTHLEINTNRPRAVDKSMIMPQKDALFGLLNILSKRTN